jgi:hypothetical protein
MDIDAILFATLGGFVIYFVFSALGRLSSGSSKPVITWDEIITEESTDFENELFEKLLKPNNIAAGKFSAAMLYFMGKPVDNSMITSSMEFWGNGKTEVDNRFNILFYSAFPDVIKWAVSNDLNGFFDKEVEYNEEGILTVDSFKKLVNLFKDKTGKSFEMSSH